MKPKIANAVILIVLLNEAKKTQMIFMRKTKWSKKIYITLYLQFLLNNIKLFKYLLL